MSEKVDILLVDDRPEGLVTLEAVLASPEYNLVRASSGNEALAKVLTHDFAVILMDVQMPEMDGFETAAIIKQRDRSKNIPIIFMTAINKSESYVSRGYQIGAVDYIFKPFDSNILRSKVAVFVDLYRKNKMLIKQSETLREIEKRDRARTLSELELEGKRRYQNLADAVPLIVWRANKNAEVEYYNQYWHLYTGLTLKQSQGFGWKEAVHPKDLPILMEKTEESFKTRTGFESEARLRRQDGQYRWHLVRVVPEFNLLSELTSWIGSSTDIHDQKLIQQELLEAKKLADSASEAKSRFLANMSHEIRTPLGAILGFSELLMNPNTSESEKKECLSTIRRNGEQLSKIIDEILDLSKVEAGRFEVERREISVIDLMNGVRALMSLSAKEKGLNFDFKVDGKIPVKISTDPTRLQQILINVVGNAIKFSAQGSVLVTVSLLNDEKPQLKIEVKDSGPGLTATQIENLFQPFTQVDASMTRRHGGTGLGLSLSRKLSRALGGDIFVSESNPGEGSKFVITIDTGPIDQSNLTDSLDVPLKAEESKKISDSLLKGVKVLLVEDSEDNQILVSRFLTMAGAHVELANNGVEGVKKAMKGDHHIVLMDIQMPELDGYGAISQLRRSGFKKPIIALTAHGMIEERKYSLQLGSNDHLTKPVNRSVLITRVHELATLSVH